LETTIQDTRLSEMKAQAGKLLSDASALLIKPDITAEEAAKALAMSKEATDIKARIDQLIQIKEAAKAFEGLAVTPKPNDDKPAPGGFKTGGEFLREVYGVTFKGKPSARLKTWGDPSEPSDGQHTGQNGWMESKDLVESIGPLVGSWSQPSSQTSSFNGIWLATA